MRTYYNYFVGILASVLLITTTLNAAEPQATDDGFVSIFNGKNFDGWNIKLRKDDDPELKKKVFTVENGMVHVFKGVPAGFDSDADPMDRRTFGAMFTDKKYSNYIFRFEYKWGNKSVNCPQELNLNNGCFYHVASPKIWPKSIEYQIQYNHRDNQNKTGAVLRGGNTFTWYAADNESNTFLSPTEGGKAITDRLKGGWFPRPIETTRERALDWNQCEIIVMGGQYAIHKLNGEIVNLITDISRSEGLIGFQAEFAEIFYRNMEIKEFEKPLPLENFMAISPSDQQGLKAPANKLAPIPEENDRIGWSADGNQHDPDDWGATAMALAVFAKAGWQDKLVHIDYNNWLPNNTPFKAAEEAISMVEGTKKFKFTNTKLFDCQTELDEAVNNVVREINKSSENSKFWYVQAGPFEVAYMALLKADPDKRKYCILVSHSAANDRPEHWPGQHGLEDCIALGAKYYFTTGQGKDKFGGGKFYEWQLVDWMKNSPNPEYRWVYSRFKKTAEHKHGVLDASDGGMAYVLVTGDVDGNFNPKLKEFLGLGWTKYMGN